MDPVLPLNYPENIYINHTTVPNELSARFPQEV